jgi:hypothetical protein
MSVIPMPVSIPGGDPDARFTVLDKVRLTSEILRIYLRVRWLMWRRPLPEVVERLRVRCDGSPIEETDSGANGGWRYAVSVVKTLRLIPLDSRCLVRSLVLLAILARRDAATTLVIGVRSEPEFGAHAWIEDHGWPLLEPGDTEQGRLLEL